MQLEAHQESLEMLSGHDNPFKPIDMDAYYLGHCDFPDDTERPIVKTADPRVKNRQSNHLRKVQASNFIQRAAIRIVDLFQREDLAS
jgi:hypothetical protein